MKRKVICTLLVLSLFLMLGSSMIFAAEYEITLGHVENTRSAVHKSALEFKSLVEDRTDGKVKVNIYPNSQLGTGTEQAQMIQSGSINMGIIPAGHMGSIFPEIQIFDIPFLLPDNLADANKVINGPAADKLFSYLEAKDLVGLANFALGFKQYTSNKPIRKPADFKGLKIRTMSSPLIVKAFKELGASPTVIDYHEVYTALQLGQVVGQENPYWGIGIMKFHEVQDYVIESNHGLYTNSVIANKRWIESLPQDIREVIAKTGKEITTMAWKEQLKKDKKYRQIIKEDPGTKIIQLTPEQRDKFRATLEPVKDMYVERLGESGEEILNAFVKQSKKYRK